MINCPNCAKEIADDSAHCGYCGQEIEQEKKKKTMFGMAALGGDELKKAVEEAKQAKEEAAASSEEGSESGGGFKLPQPGKKSGQAGQKKPGKSSGLKIPKPRQKKAEEEADFDQNEAPYAKTELIDLSGAEDDEVEPEQQPAEPEKQPAEPAGPEQPANDPDTQRLGLAGTEPELEEEAPADDGGGQQPAAAAAEQPSQIDHVAPTDPSPTNLGEPAGPAPQADQPDAQNGGAPAPAGPAGSDPAAPQGQFGQRELDLGQPPEKKSKKGLLIAIGIFLVLGSLGCLGGVAFALWYFRII